MSIVEELGARVRAAADDLPVGLLTKALEHLRVATDRLHWVRQASIDPMGVPELSAATEHGQQAAYALRMAQEQLATYLAAIGLTGDGPSGAPTAAPAGGARVTPGQPAPARPSPTLTVHRWWSARVAELTGHDDPPPADGRPATDSEELLHRVASGVRSGDRARLSAELRKVEADVGLGLAAAATPRLRRAASQLLGHPPGARDLPRLRHELTGKVRQLLPNLPPEVLETLLSRLCRTPPPNHPRQPHRADQSVAAAVLAGLLDNGGSGDRQPAAEPRQVRLGAAHD